jgi:REP-associated tyrosine transposase
MPNHLYGIIDIVDEADPEVRANCNSPQLTQPAIFNSPSKTIGAIVRGFKSAATKKINLNRNTAGTAVWQRNYYERVISDEQELNRIRKYILENPTKWQDDKYYN